ncbi:MAG: rpfC [Rickettsiaceae bacterium]|jgi:CheY-like chemotaxis protein|nr:rpfC [Rickettsiaceae bacterium]
MLQKKNYLLKDYSLFALISVGLVMAVVLVFTIVAYRDYKKNHNEILQQESKNINTNITDIFDYTNYINSHIGQQIVDHGAKDLHFILNLFRTNDEIKNKNSELFSWTSFDWVDAKNLQLVNSRLGIRKNSPDMSDREYTLSSPKNPWTLQISFPVFGNPSKTWVIPAGTGVVDKRGKYLGSVVVGFDVTELTKKIVTGLNENVSFVVLDQHMNIVLQSYDNRLEKDSDFYKKTFAGNNPFKNNFGVLDKALEIDGISYSFYRKASNYPYVTLVGFSNSFLAKEFNNLILPRILELMVLAIFFLIILYLFRTRMMALIDSERNSKESIQKLSRAVSHDIRNCVSRINNLSKIIIEESSGAKKMEAEHEQYLRLINSESQELLSFVEDLLDARQTSIGNFTLGQKTNCNIADIIKSLIDFNKGLFVKERVAVKFNAEENLPSLFCDVRRFKQIISNLLSNSAKYSNEGGVIKIDVSHLKDSKQILIEIEDQGIGMTKEQIALALSGDGKAIEKSGLNKEIDSHGIGLPTVKHLIELHSGKLEIESTKNVGSKFKLFFPAQENELNKMEAIATKEISTSKTNILIVDDHKINLVTTKSVLEKRLPEINCDIALCGEEALKIFNKNKYYDLVLTDIEMPVMNGLELAKQIRKIDSAIPIIAYTSVLKDQIEDKLKEAGIDYCVPKPTSNDYLVKTVSKWSGVEYNNEERVQKQIDLNLKEILQDKKLLLADDEALNRTLLARRLESYGLKVDVVSDGDELCEKYYQSQEYCIIVTDINMKRMNGDLALKKIREFENQNNIQNQIPAISYSGDGDQKSIHKFLRAGMDDYFIKGRDIEELIDKIVFWTSIKEQGILIDHFCADEKNKSLDDNNFLKQKIDKDSGLIINNKIDNQILGEIKGTFIEDANKLLTNIRKAKDENNLEELYFHSHALKGISGNIGAEMLYHHITHVNEYSKQEKWPDKENWFDDLERATKETVDHLLGSNS